MKKILLLFLVLNSFYTFSQVVKIPLVNKKGNYGMNKIFRFTVPLNDISGYTGYDTTKYEHWSIRKTYFNDKQAYLEDVLNKKMRKAEYENILKNNNAIDTTYLYGNVILQNSISVLTALKGQLKYVIVDENGNRDFSDDRVFVFDLTQEKIFPETEVEIKYFDGKTIKSAKIQFLIDIYKRPSFVTSVLKLDVALIDRTYKQGIYEDGKSKWTITVDNPHSFLYKNEQFSLCVDPLGKTESISDRYIYTSRDSIPIGKKLYAVKSVINDTLYLSYIAPYLKGTGERNTIAPQITGEEFLTNKHFSLYQKKGQYVLLDFWGSWCKPCIGLLPELADIHRKYQVNGLQVVSVAFDSKKDLHQLKTLINEHKLAWEHLFEDRDGSQKITRDYLVQVYPTTLLIDPGGKVVIRGTGKKSMIEIDKFLSKVYGNHSIKN